MACSTNSYGGCTTGGCGKKGSCNSGNCNRLNTFDWLTGIEAPLPNSTEIFEVRFKGTRKGFYRNVHNFHLITGDSVVVESGDRGWEMGKISLSGPLVTWQMKKKHVKTQVKDLPIIYRIPTPEDITKQEQAQARELQILLETRSIIVALKLDMKLGEIEMQADGTKVYCFYIADKRIDFRELVKTITDRFKLRVEMRQIGVRQEAGLIGGIGTCGRELCCSTWLTNFQNISTAAARYQQLAVNSLKLAGQCGRLKCCLNFELETYLDALKEIPNITKIETELGVAFLQKTDIFLKTLWFSYPKDDTWVPITAEKVVELAEMNKQGIKPPSLTSINEIENETTTTRQHDFVDVVGQVSHESLTKNEQRNFKNNNKQKRKK
ncbi:MAG: Signal peptidase-like protein [Bacteroidia bacterium]|nr:Signal peptidase-like protein [Bacteroidia bacterium]